MDAALFPGCYAGQVRAAFLPFFALWAALNLPAQTKPDLGELNGAGYRIDMPAQWNGTLIMYCHGYRSSPERFNEKPLPEVDVFLAQGYAVAQSAYAATGYAVKEAFENTEELQRFFVRKYGPAKEVFLMGHSMGGFLTMMAMERTSGEYKGGLALCGPLSSATEFMNRGAFDGYVLLDHFFPGILPDPAHILESQPPARLRDTILAALQTKPEATAALVRYSHLKSATDLANDAVFAYGMMRELTQRAGGLPFENQDVVYTVEGDSNKLNDTIKRYKADPKAAAYIATWYTPTGRLHAPMLAVHTTYDPLVPTWIPNSYIGLTRTAGSSSLFVQQYVKHDGHCAITPQESLDAFQELRAWANGGRRPLGGTVPASK